MPTNNGLLMRSTVYTCFAANSILLMRVWNHVLKKKMADRFLELPGNQEADENMKTNKLGDGMIKQLLNSVIAKHRDLSVSSRSIIYLSLRLRQ